MALSSPRAVSSSSSLNQTGQQQIKHVFVITLENENYATTFGANSKAPYLSQTLASQGAMVQQYYGTGHVSLDNYISMISGQAPTPETDNDCLNYQDYQAHGHDAGRSGDRLGLRVSGQHQDAAGPAEGGGLHMEGL